jgi:general transcription factor 3C polypeptide 5 (transcription factor C subunit 1)
LQLFEERPIWSKNGIRSQPGIQLAQDQLKHILPFVGYFWVTGPWRALWARFGYDPRRDPTAKVYQLVDYRVRQREWSR